ncbi:MAG: hypothetical protein OXG15_12825 [Gammaproteobacteria bacterium]|nr:hypothetical protein [Gammaproteobacteria bacterium]
MSLYKNGSDSRVNNEDRSTDERMTALTNGVHTYGVCDLWNFVHAMILFHIERVLMISTSSYYISEVNWSPPSRIEATRRLLRSSSKTRMLGIHQYEPTAG